MKPTRTQALAVLAATALAAIALVGSAWWFDAHRVPWLVRGALYLGVGFALRRTHALLGWP